MDKQHRSVKIEPDIMKKLVKYVATHVTSELAAKAIGISRHTLTRIIGCGTCSETTLKTIKKKVV